MKSLCPRFAAHWRIRLTLSAVVISFTMAGLSWAASQLVKPVVLLWNYPTNGITDDMVFSLHSHTNSGAMLEEWPVATSVPVTNWYSNSVCIAPVSGTNYVFSTTNMTLPGAQFFYVTASNWWGESDPSNVLGLPAAAVQPQGLKAQRGW